VIISSLENINNLFLTTAQTYSRVGTMATKFKSLLTDDNYEITESDAE
jgi:hypothetical protein